MSQALLNRIIKLEEAQAEMRAEMEALKKAHERDERLPLASEEPLQVPAFPSRVLKQLGYVDPTPGDE